MLEETRLAYERCADAFIPDWKSLDKNILVKRAIIVENEALKNAYISAIMLKYWYKLTSYYYKTRYVTCPEDVHEWLTSAVMYAINNQPWENPKSSIYQDENGPDKVINRCMESRRVTFYQQLNRYKRKINSGVISLDNLVEEFRDSVLPEAHDTNNTEIYDIINTFIADKDYITVFILDTIFYVEVPKEDMLVPKFVSKIRETSDNYLTNLANKYGIAPKELIEYFAKFRSLSDYKLKRKVEYYLLRLKLLIKDGEI